MLTSVLWHLSTKALVLVLFLQTSGSRRLLLSNKLSQNTKSSEQPCHFVQPFVGEEFWKGLARHRLCAPHEALRQLKLSVSYSFLVCMSTLGRSLIFHSVCMGSHPSEPLPGT